MYLVFCLMVSKKEREYDGNGNLVKDSDAGILRIEYNSLNLHKIRCTSA